MKASSDYKKQRFQVRPTPSASSSSPPSNVRQRRCRWESLKHKLCSQHGNVLLQLMVPAFDISSSFNLTSRNRKAFAVVILSGLVVILSRMDCFHVHYGLDGSLSDLEPLRAERGEGFIDYHFTGKGKIVYDEDAIKILKENPGLNLGELDLGFVFTPEQIGSDPTSIGRGGEISTVGNASSRTIVGKSSDDVLFHVTGERIQNALRKLEELMPRPTAY